MSNRINTYQVWQRLLDGNERFVTGDSLHPNQNASRRTVLVHAPQGHIRDLVERTNSKRAGRSSSPQPASSGKEAPRPTAIANKKLCTLCTPRVQTGRLPRCRLTHPRTATATANRLRPG